MTEQETPKSNKTSRYIFGIWMLALTVFLIFFIIALSSIPVAPNLNSQKIFLAADNILTAGPADPGQSFVFTKLAARDSLANPDLKFASSDNFVLLASALQGFYQVTDTAPVWAIAQNGSEFKIEAQLLQRSLSPELLNKQTIVIDWEIKPDYNQEMSLVAKADSKEVEAVKGEMQPSGDGIFYSAIIPAKALASAYKGNGVNPYTLLSLRAVESSTGEILVESALDLAVSPAFACGHCHTDPQYDVLSLHDMRLNTELEKQALSGKTVYCKDCHTGPFFAKGKYEQGKGSSLSAAIHAWHSPYITELSEAACLSCHIGLGRSTKADEKEENHLFMRDVHLQRGLNCTTCHGTLKEHTTALLLAEKEAGSSFAREALDRIGEGDESIEKIIPRLAWVQEPDCTSCHDFIDKPTLGSVSSFNKWTDISSGSSALYSQRLDNIGLIRCISCHGAPHAIYPAKNPVKEGRDNLQPLQYQQNARTLGAAGNCALCHTQSMEFSQHHDLVERKRIPITVPELIDLSLPIVLFAHDAHISVDCMKCHHKGYMDGRSLSCASAGCHDQVTADPAKGKDFADYKLFRTAFHGSGNSCFSCHESRQLKNEPAGPIDCVGCHSAPSKEWDN